MRPTITSSSIAIFSTLLLHAYGCDTPKPEPVEDCEACVEEPPPPPSDCDESTSSTSTGGGDGPLTTTVLTGDGPLTGP